LPFNGWAHDARWAHLPFRSRWARVKRVAACCAIRAREPHYWSPAVNCTSRVVLNNARGAFG
jgi:hypothetical protein